MNDSPLINREGIVASALYDPTGLVGIQLWFRNAKPILLSPNDARELLKSLNALNLDAH